jgi:hypothetical protein
MPSPSVFYFPVAADEQALLLRLREPDLAERRAELPELLDLIASERISAADLEQALQLWAARRQREDLDARFENLEARLHQRIDRGLAEIEGRLSRRMSEAAAAEPAPPPAPPPPSPPPAEAVPKDANIAFRIAGDLVWGPTARQFYIAVWRWLLAHGRLDLTSLPIGTGNKRYHLAAEPTHPTGRPFFSPAELGPGLYLETHMSRANALSNAVRHLNDYGVAFEIVVGEGV